MTKTIDKKDIGEQNLDRQIDLILLMLLKE